MRYSWIFFSRPQDGKLRLPGLRTDVKKAAIITEPGRPLAVRRAGKVAPNAGPHMLRVKIKAITNNHVMHLEKVVLLPAGK